MGHRSTPSGTRRLFGHVVVETGDEANIEIDEHPSQGFEGYPYRIAISGGRNALEWQVHTQETAQEPKIRRGYYCRCIPGDLGFSWISAFLRCAYLRPYSIRRGRHWAFRTRGSIAALLAGHRHCVRTGPRGRRVPIASIAPKPDDCCRIYHLCGQRDLRS